MKLFLLTSLEKFNYDTYDSCVVCAESEEAAIEIHPNHDTIKEWIKDGADLKSWVPYEQRHKKILVKYLGKASSEIEKGVVLASYNAG